MKTEREIEEANQREILEKPAELAKIGSALKKIHTKNQEQQLLLLLEKFNGTCRLKTLQWLYATIYGGTLDYMVFHGLRHARNPVYSILRREKRLPPLIGYSIGKNVFITES
jgi:hypothetical protein